MLIVLLWDPAQLYDIGFQLSFATAWGLIFFVNKVTPLFERHHNTWWYRYLAFPVIVSFVAQICSTPLIVYYFGRVPIWSLAANLVIVPLVSVAVIGVMVLLTSALAVPALGALIGMFVDAIMKLTIAGVNLFGSASNSVLEFDSARSGFWSWLLIAGVYLSFGLIGLALSRRKYRPIALITTLITVNGVLLFSVLSSVKIPGETLTFSRIPGGVAAIHHRGNWQSADLVLTGMAGKEYSVDERVIRPILEAKQITALRYVVLLRSAYPAIDDALRIAENFGADSVFVSSRQRQAVLEVSRDSSFSPILRQRISVFPGGMNGSNGDGYFPSEHALILRRHGQTLLLSNESELARLQRFLSPGMVIVLGGNWKPTPEELMLLRRAAPRTLICARIAQTGPGQGAGSARPALTDLPCPLYDLSLRNELVIPLDPGTQTE